MTIIEEASTVQFVLAIIAFICLVMIILQAAVNHRVWGWYIIGFFASVIGLAVTLR